MQPHAQGGVGARTSAGRRLVFHIVSVLALSWLVPLRSFSQPPTIGPQIRVDAAAAGKAASETSIAAASAPPCEGGQLGPRIVAIAAWNDFRSFPANDYTRLRIALTDDGGQTWAEYPTAIFPPGIVTTVEEFDPMTAADNRTGVLFAGGVWKDTAGGSGLFLARKAPCSSTLDSPTINVPVASPITVDKPWMAIGPIPGIPGSARLYVAYNAGAAGNAYVVWSDLDAAGQIVGSWSTVQIAPDGCTGLLPRVGPNGEFYVAYLKEPTYVGGPAYHALRKSVDGGVTFLAEKKFVHRLDYWDHSTGSAGRIAGTTFSPFQIKPWGCLAVSPVDGCLYFTYYDTTSYDPNTGEHNVDIWMTMSPNGVLWVTPWIISHDSLPVSDQWFNWLEIDSYGRLHLTFYSGRGITPPYPPNTDSPGTQAYYHAIYSYSDNSGATWSESFLTQQTPTNLPWYTAIWPPHGQVVGHYLGMGVAGNKAFPCYTTTQNGTPENPDSDIFVNSVTR